MHPGPILRSSETKRGENPAITSSASWRILKWNHGNWILQLPFHEQVMGWRCKNINFFVAGKPVNMEPTFAEAFTKRRRVFSSSGVRSNYWTFTKNVGEDASDRRIPKVGFEWQSLFENAGWGFESYEQITQIDLFRK
jgi:hypothetical protein